MNKQTWWYMARASGIVAWVVLAVTCLWGILLVTRMLKPADRPAWLLDLHRWLGALAVMTTGVHLATLVADNFVHFGWKEILVPQGSPWKTGAVTWGVLAMYIVLIVQASSLMMRKLPRKVWHGIHLLSYVSFVMATVHGVAAGTDRGNTVFVVVLAGVASVVLAATVARILQGQAKNKVKAQRISAV